MATNNFAITPDLQQIKQFQATSGRAVTSQAIQGITQQAIKTAAGRAEQQRSFALKERELNDTSAFRSQSLALEQDRLKSANEQRAVDTKFRQEAFNKELGFKKEAFDKDFRLRETVAESNKRHQEGLLNISKEQLDLSRKRLGVAQGEFDLRAEAQDFNQGVTVDNINRANRSEDRAVAQIARGESINNDLAAAEIKSAARVELRQSFGGFMSLPELQQLQAFDARPASSFLPDAVNTPGAAPVTREQLTDKQQRQQDLFGRHSNF